MLSLADRIPDVRNAFCIQLHRNRHDTLLHRHGNGLDAQCINAGILNALQFNNADTQLIQKLRQFDFFLKRQGEFLAALLHGHVADSDSFHNNFSFSFLRDNRNP